MLRKKLSLHTQRKFVLPVVVFGALVIAGFASSASGPNAQLVSQNRVYGGGQFTGAPDGNPRNFAVDAHAGPSGQAAFGDIEYGSSLHAAHEQVTCLTVSGNKATVGAVVTQADRPQTVGFLVLMVLVDNGNPTSGTPDQSTLQIQGPVDDPDWPAGFPNRCPSPDAAATLFGLGYFSLGGGNLVIQNAK